MTGASWLQGLRWWRVAARLAKLIAFIFPRRPPL